MSIVSALLRRRPRAETIDVRISDAATGRAQFRMLWVEDRDQTAQFVKKGGWTAFEPPAPQVLFRLMRRRPGLMIDAGANTGFYGLLAAAAHRSNRVLAFEPDPKVFPILAGNVEVNGLARRMRPSTAALSDREGTAQLYVPWDDHGVVETSSSLEAGFKPRHQDVLSVPVTTVDRAVADGSGPVLIKIDVEGHELAVLRGAEGVLAAHRPIVLVELLATTDWAGLNGLVAKHRYGGVSLSSEGRRLTPTLSFDPQSWNQVLCPIELWPVLDAVLASSQPT